MTFLRRSRKPRPSDAYDVLAMPKVRRDPNAEPMDTRGLPQQKLRPNRNEAYRNWLRLQPCSVRGLVDSETDQKHVCWSPQETSFGRPLSDPAHTSRAGMGIKANDSECIPLCRHAHRASEGQESRFDRRFGIDRFAIAAEHFARFEKEQERRNG